MRIPIDEVVYFDCITSHPSTGAVTDADSTPTFDVYEEATDTGLLGATNLTNRTSLTGDYRGTFTASAANGFEAGKWYSVIASATVNSIAGKARVMHFQCVPAESIAGVAKVDVSHLLGTAWLTPGTAGTPDVNVKLISGDATAADNAESFFDGTGYAGTNNVIPLVTLVTTTTDLTNKGTGSGFTAIPWNAAWDAEVQSECEDALAAVGVTTTVTGRIDAAVSSRMATFTLPTNFSALLINASGHISRATLVDTTTTNTDMLTQANVRSAVGLASANLDTQLDALPTAAENATAVLAAGDVDGYTLEQTLKLCLAALAGKLSGAATTTIAIRAADDSKARLTATVDSDGNRTSVTLDAAG